MTILPPALLIAGLVVILAARQSNFAASSATAPATSGSPTITPTGSGQVLIVDNLLDTDDGACVPGKCSLRDAIAAAGWGATIRFGVSGPIALTKAFTIDKSLSIIGPGPTPDALVVSGGNPSVDGIFNVVSNISMSISYLTLTKGGSAGGGGVFDNGGQMFVSNCIFRDNFGGLGGAIDIKSGDVKILNSAFQGNRATSGGAIEVDGGNLTIMRSLFQNNRATGGGAIVNWGGMIDIANSTFDDNTATGIADIQNGSSQKITIENSTIRAKGQGNEVIINSVDRSEINISNTILYNYLDGVTCNGHIVDKGNNLQYPGSDCGTAIPVVDPKLGSLTDNGGPTQTIALLFGSPAIGAGNPTICSLPEVGNLDQRGMLRKAACDIGAFEYGALAVTAVPVTLPATLSALSTH